MRIALMGLLVFLLAGAALAEDAGPEINRAGLWFRSAAQTEPVNAGEGYFAVRLVQAQLTPTRPGWLTSLFTGNKGAKDLFVTLQLDYGENSFQTPVAWGEVRPDRPRLPQMRLQCTPWLPVITKSGAPLQPKLKISLRTVPVANGGILPALRTLAERATSSEVLGSFAAAGSPLFTYQDIFEGVFGSLGPAQAVPMAVNFEVSADTQMKEMRFARYLLITDAGNQLSRKVNGVEQTYKWEDWEKYLKVPAEGSTSPYITWADTGEPVTEPSFILLEVRTLPHFFSDLSSVQSAPELWKTLHKLVLAPLTTSLRGSTTTEEAQEALRAHLDQLREWLWSEQAGISMKDIETICTVVGDRAIDQSGARPLLENKSWGVLGEIPGVSFPPTPTREPTADRRPLHQVSAGEWGGGTAGE
ncbi:MAG TPA: hypothetical protein VGM19_08860 [Armatimonadota bacterium]|jgi:hypothetical protein